MDHDANVAVGHAGRGHGARRCVGPIVDMETLHAGHGSPEVAHQRAHACWWWAAPATLSATINDVKTIIGWAGPWRLLVHRRRAVRPHAPIDVKALDCDFLAAARISSSART